MKEDVAALKIFKLDFEKYSGRELVETYAKINLPNWAREVVDFLKELISEEKISCFTSGTTGSPKKVTFTRGQLEEGARNTLSFFNLQKGNKALLPLSCNHIAGKMMIVRALIGQLKLSIIEPAGNLIEAASREFDFSVVIPLQIHTLLDSKDEFALSRLGKILVGGSEINQNIVNGLNAMQAAAWSSFGMTETMSHFALRQLSPGEQKHYVCLKGFEISNKFKSQLMLKNESLSIAEMQTNDVVNIFPDGTFIWLGRADYIVNSGGVKLHPESIENKIKKFFPLLPAFIVVGVPDSKLGEKLVLFHEGSSFLSEQEKTSLQMQLGKYECPKEFILVKMLERTKSGKIIRKKLD